MKRDGASVSIWQNMEGYIPVNTFDVNKEYDVIIVGAGITGITTALQLQASHLSCLLVEANTIGFGTSSGTTAHLNTFFDTTYQQVIKNFGEKKAKLLVKAAKSAMSLIKQNIALYKIDCGYENKEGYLFSLNEKQNKELEEIVESARHLGLPIAFSDHMPFPIPYLKLACIKRQAQFNPMQYIVGLAKEFENKGGVILQNTRVTGIDEGDIVNVHTSTNEILKARNIIYATHIPPGTNLLHFRCAPYRSYAMGVKLKDNSYPNALGYDMNDPYHYYRTQIINGEKYLIAGGEDHKTGHEENTQACFRRLESYIKSYFPVDRIAFRWSSQYFEPADGLPYIGNLPGNGKNVYVATGLGGNGMVYGTLSATILSDLIVNGESIYEDLFDPNRLKPVAGFTNFIEEGADVVGKLISSILPMAKIDELSDMAAGEARVVKYKGNTVALYKDEQHQVHAVDSKCTHMNCTVAWNSVEKSWDCPCHGSRFSYDGSMLTGPAVNDLELVTSKIENLSAV
ncbi:MAG TPA: FAD-dependent oxidoreductase [Ferruginibacter sp.]|jgi:glycine/D-amino acid oxidase-like deaminating enzyme/nitrite reductase/ring-hydroxylating ferredoxin subunit|nr:FAD-dependent oxidoreductase [Ferruginibacter sp.]